MQRVVFTESDPKFNAELAAFLIQNHGATPVALDLPDNFDINSVHGLAISSQVPAVQTASRDFAQEFADVAAWLNNYKGNFEFYLSLRDQMTRNGKLSPKQIGAVKRAIDRDRAAGIQLVTPEVKRDFSLADGTTVILKKFIANRIAHEAGFERAHRAFDVLTVLAETPKAYRVRLRLSARKTVFCGICGQHLTDPQSIAAGIGPICADNYGISHGGASIEELNAKLSVTAEVETWLPKSQIKETILKEGKTE